MNREVAIRVDGMLIAIRATLDGVAHYIKNNASEEESKAYIRHIGESMGAIIDISEALYREHPDIIPAELVPSPQQE